MNALKHISNTNSYFLFSKPHIFDKTLLSFIFKISFQMKYQTCEKCFENKIENCFWWGGHILKLV